MIYIYIFLQLMPKYFSKLCVLQSGLHSSVVHCHFWFDPPPPSPLLDPRCPFYTLSLYMATLCCPKCILVQRRVSTLKKQRCKIQISSKKVLFSCAFCLCALKEHNKLFVKSALRKEMLDASIRISSLLFALCIKDGCQWILRYSWL